MTKIHCLNPIAEIGMKNFGEGYEKVENFAEAEAVLVRSAAMHDLELPDQLLAIARAGAGVNNIPLDKCAEKGIVVFNTPGANANGVKELVIAGLLMASRDLTGGYNWVKENAADPDIAKAVEKNKSKFAGGEIQGKKLGVIGLGAIGVLVANAAAKLGMEVLGYDPYVSVDAAWKLSKDIKHITNVEDIYREADYITMHVPLLDSTKEMICKKSMDMMKDGVKILNFSRDALVNDADMKEALASGKVSVYVTDFPNASIAGTDKVVTLPHLGASTAESEDNCAVMAVKEIVDYIENGNIKNSVNYPACDMGVCQNVARVTINHRNIPNIISQFTSIISAKGINISDMMNKSKGEYAYSILDMDSAATDDIVEALEKIDGVLKVRVVK